MKLRLLVAASLAALALTAGTVSAQDTTSDKGKLSYALGYRAGMSLQPIVASGEQVDMNTFIKAVQDAMAGKQVAVPEDQLQAAMEGLRTRMAAKYKAELEKRAAKNKADGDTYLAQNKGKAGVKVLPSGVQYKVVEAGSGAKRPRPIRSPSNSRARCPTAPWSPTPAWPAKASRPVRSPCA